MIRYETPKSGVTGDETDDDGARLKKAKLVSSFQDPTATSEIRFSLSV
jgi:hypothetical protein